MNDLKKIKVEIWSDEACPFCYIGKRKFEDALAKFEHKDNVEIEWKSFILDPNKVSDPSMPLYESLAKRKGISTEQAKEMGGYATEAAHKVGLKYDFDKTIVANTFNIHRFLHFAKTKGVQNEAKEIALHAYFTDGKNIDDTTTLLELGTKVGLDMIELENVLKSDTFKTEVEQDIAEAQEIGVQGVPFFVFDRKFAVSGAQESQVMLNTLEKVFTNE
jgi:predicted DsbA family dithiol-disulfide isomerase